MTTNELLARAAKDEVLREWLSSRAHDPLSPISVDFANREEVAVTPSSFNGSVGEMADGRLIKTEFSGSKGIDEKVKITVERPHKASPLEPYDIALLTELRVSQGMLNLDFGPNGYAEIVFVHGERIYEGRSGRRVEITFADNETPEFGATDYYRVSMSETAYKATNIQLGKKMLLVWSRLEDEVTTYIVGVAEATPSMIATMLNGWVAPATAP